MTGGTAPPRRRPDIDKIREGVLCALINFKAFTDGQPLALADQHYAIAHYQLLCAAAQFLEEDAPPEIAFADPTREGCHDLTRDLVLGLAKAVRPLRLAEMLADIRRVDTIAPILDPGAYQTGAGHMHALARIARAALAFQREVETAYVEAADAADREAILQRERARLGTANAVRHPQPGETP